MSGVNEWIVREYFESLGYLVSQPRKYAVPPRHKTADEEVDMLVFNPQIKEHRLPGNPVWTTQDLKGVARAVVGVRGWHTERFYVSKFKQMPDILRFAEADSIRFAAKLLASGSMAKILCLPKLPVSGELKKKTITVLKDKGIDGIISFRTMLLELISRVDINKNYEKSDLLQVIRLLKNYDLLKDTQMDLFDKKNRRVRRQPDNYSIS